MDGAPRVKTAASRAGTTCGEMRTPTTSTSAPSSGDTTLEPAPDGGVLRTRTTDLDGFARFLLGQGRTLAVHELAELQEALRRVARDIMQVANEA